MRSYWRQQRSFHGLYWQQEAGQMNWWWQSTRCWIGPIAVIDVDQPCQVSQWNWWNQSTLAANSAALILLAFWFQQYLLWQRIYLLSVIKPHYNEGLYECFDLTKLMKYSKVFPHVPCMTFTVFIDSYEIPERLYQWNLPQCSYYCHDYAIYPNKTQVSLIPLL